ncbi:F-box/FBD/LRR-repeat protein At1g13570-like isoform X1 [Fagus crenata]
MTHKSPLASDIISDLPSNIIESILVHLPLRDAVKTSVLSRKWRYNWVTLPQLVFDNSFCTGPPQNQAMRKELFMTIYQVLLLHNGPILKFTLSTPGLRSCPEINHLISFLSRNNIQDFYPLHFKGHLHLLSCLFKPPTTFNGFNRLVSLVFREVDIAVNIFKTIVPKCPLLKHLTLENCTNTENLNIDAPNLKFLYFRGLFNSLRFKNTPVLASVKFLASREEIPEYGEFRTADMIKVFHCLPVIEDLFAGYSLLVFLAAGNIPDRLPATLEFLKTLVLSEICFGVLREASCALCLIRSSPNLEKLKFKVNHGATADEVKAVVEYMKAQDFSDMSLNKLREVKMLSFSGSKPEMEFVKLLLDKSPLLKTMHIHPKRGDSLTGFRILKEVTRFRRASSTAEIIYLDTVEGSV